MHVIPFISLFIPIYVPIYRKIFWQFFETICCKQGRKTHLLGWSCTPYDVVLWSHRLFSFYEGGGGPAAEQIQERMEQCMARYFASFFPPHTVSYDMIFALLKGPSVWIHVHLWKMFGFRIKLDLDRQPYPMCQCFGSRIIESGSGFWFWSGFLWPKLCT